MSIEYEDKCEKCEASISSESRGCILCNQETTGGSVKLILNLFGSLLILLLGAAILIGGLVALVKGILM